MSRTIKGSKLPNSEFGTKYKINYGYSGGSGIFPKNQAAIERRNDSKKSVRHLEMYHETENA